MRQINLGLNFRGVYRVIGILVALCVSVNRVYAEESGNPPLSFSVAVLDSLNRNSSLRLNGAVLPENSRINGLVVFDNKQLLPVGFKLVQGTIKRLDTSSNGKNRSSDTSVTSTNGAIPLRLPAGQYSLTGSVELPDGRKGTLSESQFVVKKLPRGNISKTPSSRGTKLSLVNSAGKVVIPDLTKSTRQFLTQQEQEGSLKGSRLNVKIDSKKGKKSYFVEMINTSGAFTKQRLAMNGSSLQLDVGSLLPGFYLFKISATGSNGQVMPFAVLVFIPRFVAIPTTPLPTVTVSMPVTQTPTPRPTNTSVPATPTVRPTNTAAPATPSPTQTPTRTPTPVPTATISATRTPAVTPSATPLPTISPLVCEPSKAAPPPRRVWLLSNLQYRNTLRALMPLATAPILDIVPDSESTYGGTLSDLMRLGRMQVARSVGNAQTIAAHVRQNIAQYVSCDIQLESCVQTFLNTFGMRAFRRPLTAAQIDSLLRIYRIGKETNGARGFELMVQALLQSASFLYRSELGTTMDPNATRAQLSAYEIAESLSYPMTDAPPDSELMIVAANGSLMSDAIFRGQVLRLLSSPAGQSVYSRFVDNLLSASMVTRITKDPSLVPTFTPALAGDMREQLRLFVNAVASSPEPTIASLLTSKTAFINQRTAPLFGMSATGGAFQSTTLQSSERVGILTQPVFAAVYSQADHVVPTSRGRFIYTQILCRPMGTPPTIDPNLPIANPSLSPRERLQMIKAFPGCASCHVIADPIGFALDKLDPIGAERATYKGAPIDTSGEITRTRVTDGAFTGVSQLMQRLSASREVRECFTTQFVRFSQGRVETEADSCRLVDAQKVVEDSGGTLASLVNAAFNLNAIKDRAIQQ